MSRSLLTAIFLLYIVSLVVLRSLPLDGSDHLSQGHSVAGHNQALGPHWGAARHPTGEDLMHSGYNDSGSNGFIIDNYQDALSQLSPHLIINQPHLCEPNEDTPVGPYLLILVLSHGLNYARRNAIRDTWGRITHDYDNPQYVSVLFLLGSTGQEKEDQHIGKEATLYRDILQGDFIDGYHNLSSKSVMGLGWVAKYCSQAKYIMKTDDDVFLNISSILDFLYIKSRTKLLVGHVNTDAYVMRIGQWAVSNKDYPFSKYPPYCSGACYIMSSDTVRALCQSFTAGNDKVFPVEDVFITGLLAKQANIDCIHDHHFPTWTTLITPGTVSKVLMSQLFGVHGVSYERMYILWRMDEECWDCGGNLTAIDDYLNQQFQYLNEYEDMDEGFTDV